MTDRSFDDSIITNASTVRARDWRTLSSRSDSRYDISPRVSMSPRNQTSSRGSSTSHMIIAICEGRGNARREIGLAAMNQVGSTLELFQFPDSYTYPHLLTKIEVLEPNEILISSKACEGTETMLMELLLNFNPDMFITKIERQFFRHEEGLRCIRNICHQDYLTKIMAEVRENYYCLCAAAALIRYIESTQSAIIAVNSTRVVYSGSEKSVSIDPSTAKALELITNRENGKTEFTLFHFLNHTTTKLGYRSLRATVREPSTDQCTIEARLDLVTNLITEPSGQLLEGLSKVLSNFSDLESLVSYVLSKPRANNDHQVGEKQIEVLIHLRHVLSHIQPFRDLLSTAEHPLFQHYNQNIQDQQFTEILDIINRVIDSDCKLVNGLLNIKHQKVFAIKKGFDGYLDSKREAYSRVLDETSHLAAELTQNYNYPIKMSYSNLRGYHFTVSVKDEKYTDFHGPPEFVRVSQTRNQVAFTTMEMIEKNGTLSQALEDIFVISRQILVDTMSEIRERIGFLHKLTEVVAFLDMILSFAHASCKYEMVRPVLNEKRTVIRDCYHPVLLIKEKKENITPNEIYLDEDSNIWILRGPNMSGKSTFLKQICLLQILAQCGCYVPAVMAHFKLINQIMTRVGTDDDLETNSSTFSKEVQEVKYILDSFTENSLIIIDEFGRGTAYEEGLALSWTVLEQFIDSKAFVLCATHFSILGKMDSIYPEISTHCLTEEHRMAVDDTMSNFYGLEIASTTELPPELIQNAYAKAVRMKDGSLVWNQDINGQIRKKRFKIGRNLLMLAERENFDPEKTRDYLKQLKRIFLDEMHKIKYNEPQEE
ncbi:mutS protein homolog 4-like [Brevipalpus obovatus]|uniref:mutS protein homolog 4-like n=1 Tax=Brevipalpus obovatus TaxID=246614 RepID=UPI003D9F4777